MRSTKVKLQISQLIKNDFHPNKQTLDVVQEEQMLDMDETEKSMAMVQMKHILDVVKEKETLDVVQEEKTLDLVKEEQILNVIEDEKTLDVVHRYLGESFFLLVYKMLSSFWNPRDEGERVNQTGLSWPSRIEPGEEVNFWCLSTLSTLFLFCLQQVFRKEEEDCGGELVVVETGGRDVKLDLSRIDQVLLRRPDPLVCSPPILPWQRDGGHLHLQSSAPNHRMHFPFPKYRNQAFLDARQCAVALAVFSSSNPSQVRF